MALITGPSARDVVLNDRIFGHLPLIELDEGPLVSSTLVGSKTPKDVYDVGQKVVVVYEDHPAEGFTLPRFRIVD